MRPKRTKKEYDRETKTYVPVGSLKKRQTCYGGKKHDFVLVLPHQFMFKDGKEDVEKTKCVYQFLDDWRWQIDDINKSYEKVIFGYDVEYSHRYGLYKGSRYQDKAEKTPREYMCSRCGKQKIIRRK